MKLTKEQALELVQNKKLELGDGRILQFRMTPSDLSINEWECYGTVEHIRHGNTARPKHFDGMAEKIWGYNEQYWWQPPADLRSNWHSYEHKNKFRETVRNILSFGFDDYWIELCQGENAYGDPIVVDYVALGGLEPLQDDTDMADTVVEMSCELDMSVKGAIA